MGNRVLLQTTRLTLRRFKETDFDHIFALDNDPEVMRHINGGAPTPSAVLKTQIFPNFLRADETGFGFWAIETKNSGQFLGWISLRLTGPNQDAATLGFRLRRESWGQGIATEAARALLLQGFAQMGVRRVIATTYEKNRASQRVLEKLGFRLARRFRLTPADLENSDTHYAESLEVWDGDDLAYVLEQIRC